MRQAIAHAIDKDTLVDRVLKGLGLPGQSMNVAVAPKWNLKVPADKEMEFNIAEANRILDDAGYKKGSDGIRDDAGRQQEAQLPLLLPADDSAVRQERGVHQGMAQADRHRHDASRRRARTS